MNFYTFFAILVLYYMYGADIMKKNENEVSSKKMLYWKRFMGIAGSFVVIVGVLQGVEYITGFSIADNVKNINDCNVKLVDVEYDGTFNIENASTTNIAMPIKIVQNRKNCIKSLEVYSTTFNDYTSTNITNNGKVEDFLISQSVQNYNEVDLMYLSYSEVFDISETRVQPKNFNEKELYFTVLSVPSDNYDGDKFRAVNNANRNIINHYFISINYNDKVESYLYMYKETLNEEKEVYLENINNVRKTDVNKFITSNTENLLCFDIAEPNFDISITKDNYCIFAGSTYSNVDDLYKERMIQKNVDTTDDGISITWYGDDMSDEIEQKLNASFVDSYIEMIIEQLDNLQKK